MYFWVEPELIPVPAELQDFVGGHPLVAQTLVRRGITTVAAARAFLHPDAYTPASPLDLPGLERAVERLETAIRQGERICVWGDFDVDGQTATSLLVGTLRDLGAEVIYHIPVRGEESHGITIPYLQRVLDQGTQLILTCDTGISEHEAVAYAQARGVDVVITDHHELAAMLPEAYAVVNPHLLPESHPLATLPGVGVAYKLAEALYARAGRADEVTRHLDLVALGIVADVAEQTGDTRYLLQRGLEVLHHTSRLGVQALMDVAQLDRERLTEEDIGFWLGPRMNALGRLADANDGVTLLTTDDLSQARILASQLEALNERRKQLCEDVFQGAEALLARDPSLLDYGALVLANAHWPGGVVGIVASRLAEKYNRPTVLLTTSEGGLAHGSARSVEGCHLTEAIATQAALLEQFGGHAMAAGLSLAVDKIPDFRFGLSRAVMAQLGRTSPQPTLHIDGYLPFSELSLDLLEDLGRLAPFGAGNPPLVLATRGVAVQNRREIGRNGNHLKLLLEDEPGVALSVLRWQGGGEILPEGRFDLAYRLGVNTYRGATDLQVVWVDARETAAPEAPVREVRTRVAIEDHRREIQPLLRLQALYEPEMQVWEEAGSDAGGSPRSALTTAPVLVIWTTPPGPLELQEVLARVKPGKVILFAHDPGLDSPKAFLERLAGLVKYALRQSEGQLSISRLAEATAQRPATVHKGVEWLEAQGHLTIVRREDDLWAVAPGTQTPEAASFAIGAELKTLLEETAAYRCHFAQADKALLVSF